MIGGGFPASIYFHNSVSVALGSSVNESHCHHPIHHDPPPYPHHLGCSAIARVARALIGKRTGERVRVLLGAAEQELEVLAIAWPDSDDLRGLPK